MSVAKALIECHPKMYLGHIDLDNSAWTGSLFQNMKFVSCVGEAFLEEI